MKTIKFEDLRLPPIDLVFDRCEERDRVARAIFDQMKAHYEGKEQPTPEWRLPDPPPGQQWHRDDWTQDMLPEGYRPLLDGEEIRHGDEYNPDNTKDWIAQDALSPTTAAGIKVSEATGSWWKHRTRRPLPAPVEYVPLGPEDVPPGSAVRHMSNGIEWEAVQAVLPGGVCSAENSRILWRTLFEHYEIFRPNSATWEPCKKPKA